MIQCSRTLHNPFIIDSKNIRNFWGWYRFMLKYAMNSIVACYNSWKFSVTPMKTRESQIWKNRPAAAGCLTVKMWSSRTYSANVALLPNQRQYLHPSDLATMRERMSKKTSGQQPSNIVHQVNGINNFSLSAPLKVFWRNKFCEDE